MLPIKFQDNPPFVLEEEAKNRLKFSSEQILAIFYLQVTLMLPTKFHVSWPFSSGEEAKKKISKMATILAF